MDAQETVATYVKRVRAIKAQSIALILANLVGMIWFVEEGHFALYLVCFVFLLAIVLIARVRMGALFLKLGEVVSQDCDPARYRAALDVLSARDRFGRSTNTIAIELAYCDYLELDSAGALRRLESVTFKRKVADYTVLVRLSAERDAADAARMRERMALADCHQQRANWQLYLAEYELLHGSADQAARLAGDPTLEPLTPRMERLRAEVLSGLEVNG